MKGKIKYFKYLLKHKWYVMVECFKFELTWRGLTHDLSKFSPKEFFPYANFFYGKNGALNKSTNKKNGYCKPKETGDPQFDSAWQHHCNTNKHHWQWWVRQNDKAIESILPMQEPYLTEMLCDWVGAGKAQGHFSPEDDPFLNVRNWYKENSWKIKLHEQTKRTIEERIGYTYAFNTGDKKTGRIAIYGKPIKAIQYNR